MIELAESVVRTPRGKIHRVMLDGDNKLYVWKQCRLTDKEFEFVTHDELSEADERSFCQLCLPTHPYSEM